MIESEHRTLQSISSERLNQAEEDSKEVDTELARLLASHQQILSKLNEEFDTEQTELFMKYSPTVDSCEKQLSAAENDINNSIDSMNQMKERLFELKDNLKSMIVEHANKVAKDVVSMLTNQENSLKQAIEEEESAIEDLTKTQEVTEKMISAVQSKFSEQMTKAERVLGVLKKSRDKMHSELEAAVSEKNQLAVIHSHREEAYYQLLEEIKQRKEAFEELSEAMEMYKQYKELRTQNPHSNIPMTHNNALNKIISIDNILEQEAGDYKDLISQLKRYEEDLQSKHANASQAISEIRGQYNKALEATKQLSYEINKVFSHVSVQL